MKDDDRTDNRPKKKLHHSSGSVRLKKPPRCITYYKGDFQLERTIEPGDPNWGWWCIWKCVEGIRQPVARYWKKEDAMKVWDTIETPPPVDAASSHNQTDCLKREHSEIQLHRDIEFWNEASLHRK